MSTGTTPLRSTSAGATADAAGATGSDRATDSDRATGSETHQVLPDKFAIAGWLADRLGPRDDVDAIDISGAVLVDPTWRDLLRRRSYRGGRWRLLLLRPWSAGAQARAAESPVWSGDTAALSRTIEERAHRLRALAAEFDLDLTVHHYDTVPVTRYLRVGDEILQSWYPGDATGRHQPVVRLSEGSVLRHRARKEFDVAWARALREH